MTKALSVKRSVRLTVYDFDDFFEEKREQIMKMLVKLSGLHVKVVRGFLFRKKFYVYFDDIDSANAAALAVVCIAYCQTKVCRGTFDVTNLVRNNNTATPKNSRLQAQGFLNPKPSKETNYVNHTIKNSNARQSYKDINVNSFMNRAYK